MSTDQLGRIGAARACITDPRDSRLTGVATLLRDANMARALVGWSPKTLAELVTEKVAADCAAAKRDRVIKLAGIKAYDCNE